MAVQQKVTTLACSVNGLSAQMLSKDYSNAINLLKADIAKSAKEQPDGSRNEAEAKKIMNLYMNLGFCYEVLNRSDEAQIFFESCE